MVLYFLSKYFPPARMALMSFGENIFLGILQGLTEFLPISSSGHLFLAETFLGLEPNLNLEISLHAAGLLAVLIFFHKRLWRIVRGFGQIFGICSGDRQEGILGAKLIVATLLTVPIALGVQSQFDVLLSIPVVALTLIFTGIFILAAEKWRPQKLVAFSWPLVFLLGIVQGFAVVPGISRSGLTISLLILLGIERTKSTEISFLLAIPTILGALVFSLGEVSAFPEINTAFFVGCFASFLASLAAIQWMMKLIQKHWIWFAPYCILAGGGLLIWISSIH